MTNVIWRFQLDFNMLEYSGQCNRFEYFPDTYLLHPNLPTHLFLYVLPSMMHLHFQKWTNLSIWFNKRSTFPTSFVLFNWKWTESVCIIHSDIHSKNSLNRRVLSSRHSAAFLSPPEKQFASRNKIRRKNRANSLRHKSGIRQFWVWLFVPWCPQRGLKKRLCGP